MQRFLNLLIHTIYSQASEYLERETNMVDENKKKQLGLLIICCGTLR